MRTFLIIGALLCAVQGDREIHAGRYGLAERRIKRGLALARRAGHFDSALGIRLLNSLGMIYKYEGRFAHSARAYRRAVRLAKRHVRSHHLLFASLFHNLAGLEHARGRYDSAEPIARHGLAIRARALGSRHPDVGRDLAALGAILDGDGSHAEAEPMHRRALEIFERHGRSGRRDTAYTLGNLAACLHLTGRSEEAEALARRAIAMQTDLLGSRHPDIALSLANLSVIKRERITMASRGRHRGFTFMGGVSQRMALPIVLLCVSSLVPPSLHAQRNVAWAEIANPAPQYASVDTISPAAKHAMGAGGWKSPSRAFLYSFLGTAIPVGVGGATALGNNELSAGALVAIGGAVIGPSLGHFYAQRKGRAIRGIVIRGAAAGIMAATVSSSNEGSAVLYVGALLVGATFLVADITGAAPSARGHNQKLAGQARFCVSPVVRPIVGAPGIGLRVAY